MNQFYAGRKLGLLVIVFISLSLVTSANTYTVTNANSTGPGSFEQAILDANANPGADIIDFNIPGTGPFTITPTGFPGLPVITGPVSINGYTQPGSVMGPIPSRIIQIELLGNPGLGFSSGITINSDNVTVSGLSIGGFSNSGVTVQNGHDNIQIWGNFIGMDPSGVVPIPNLANGVNLGENDGGGSSNVTVGTNSDGAPNDAAEGNLISANGQDGIIGITLTNSVIAGNFIGSDRFGIADFGNVRNGILLATGSNNNRIGTNGDGTNDLQEHNGIVYNGVGILIAASSNFNTIAGNIVGVSLDMNNNAAPNGIGIEIRNSSSNRIGVNTAHSNYIEEANLIGFNSGDGIQLHAETFFFNMDAVAGNIVSGNYIGTDPNGSDLGNEGNGISFISANGISNSSNIIGSNNDGSNDNAEGNTIAHNFFAGIGTDNTPDIFGNSFSRNSIHDNGGLGVDLGGNGVTPNDQDDLDTGPNGYFNHPVILSASGDGFTFTVTGVAEPGTLIEFYLSDGNGEGQTYLFSGVEGSASDNDPNPGMYTDPVNGPIFAEGFSFSVPVNSLPPGAGGANIVALGTNVAGDNSSSEFGAAVLILPVTLTNFKAQLLDGIVRLNWNTSREVNSSHFVIEKSIDGNKFSPIGQVKSGAANGVYSFTDNTPLGKLNYYRLRIFDIDGHSATSKTLIVRNDGELLIVKMTPNPVSSYMNVSFKLERDELVRVNIFDQTGRVVKRYTLQGGKGINAFTLSDIGNLPAGNYVVDLKGETISAKQKVIKQ